MAKISLKNFRKYDNLDSLQLNDINIFVGKNNAGKSTVVKAIMLALDNIRSLRWTNVPHIPGIHTLKFAPVPYFRFDANDFHNLHIGTFERAKCNYIDDRRISICLEYQGIEFTIVVAGSMGDGQVSLPVDTIKLDFDSNIKKDSRKGCYEFDFTKKTMTFSIEGEETNEGTEHDNLQALNNTISEMETELKKAMEKEDALTIAELQNNLRSLRTRRNHLAHRSLAPTNVQESFDLSYFQDMSGNNVLVQYIRSFIQLRFTQKEKGSRKSSAVQEDMAKRAILAEYSDVIVAAAQQLEGVLNSVNVDYIQAHAAAQKLILSAEDRNDINSRAVHEFYQEHIQRGDKAEQFFSKWLKAFEIGEGLSIKPLDGEGYYVIVDNGENDVHLADMGMGSIQLVILLLRLTTIANRIQNSGQAWWIIVEEPEQNIHPMLQSKLAKLFKEFQEEFSSTIIIETHSEYLVRNTQAMVAEQKFRDQDDLDKGWPIRVYYFPSEYGKQPYDMKYMPDGRFTESFGEGFYDEAGTLSMKLPGKMESESPSLSINWDSLK